MINALILKILSGSVVGYTTNDLALRMLFDKVLGIPSIVEQTKDSFIKNISQLVESEIIRHDNISEEVKKDKFRESLQIMLSEFVERQLRSEFSEDEKIGDIPGIDQSVDKLLDIINDNTNDVIRKGVNGIFKHTLITDFTSKHQIQHVCEELFQLISHALQEDRLIEIFVNDVWHEIKRDQAQEVIAPIIFESVSGYTSNFFDELHETLKKGDLPLNDFIDKLLYRLDTENLIGKISDSISKKKISDILGSGDEGKIAKEFHRILSKELNDPSPDAPIKRLISIFVDLIRQEETTIFQILPPAIGNNFEKFIRKNIPIILDAVIEWIQENREEINELVNTSFEENSSFLGGWLINLFVDSVSERFKVVDEIINITNKHKSEDRSKELAEKGADLFLKYLKENSIGSLINRFDQKAIVNSIHKLLIGLLDHRLLGKGADSISLLLDRKVGQLWSSNKQKEDLSKLTKYLIDEKLVSDFLYQRKSTDTAKQIVQDRLDRIKEQPLYSIFNDKTIEGFATKAQNYSLKLVEEEKIGVISTTEKVIWNEIQNKSISKVIGNNSVERWTPKLKQISQKFLQQFSQKIKSRPIHDLVGIAEKTTSLPLKLANGIVGYIDRNINRLMKGQVSKVVEKNLHNKHQQLPEMVKGFMGNNMQPITYFGAFLGAIAGGLTAYIPFGDTPTTLIAGIAGVYGITGLATNWIAIKMIFRPYRPKYLFGFQLPFTPSVISSNQSKFAENMGDFVGKQLLNEESIGSDIEEKISSLKDTIFNTFVESDYKTLDKLLETEKKSIGKKISKEVSHQLFSNRYEYAEKAAQIIDKELESFNNFSENSLQTTFINFTHKDVIHTTLAAFLSKRVVKILENDLMLSDALPDKFVQQMFEAVSDILSRQIDKSNTWIQDESLFDKLKMMFRDKLMFYRSKKINELELLENNKVRIKSTVWNLMLDTLEKDTFQQQLLNFFEKQFEKLSDDELPIRDLFDGKPYQFLQQNSISLVDKLMQQVIGHLKDNDDRFAEEVYETVVKKRSLATLYEGHIKRTTKDLANNKIPNLLMRGLPEITQKIQDKISIIAQETKVKDLEVSINNEVLHDAVVNLMKNNRLLTSIQYVMNRIVDEIFDTKIENILNVGEISEDELYDTLSSNLAPEIDIIRQHLASQLYQEDKKELIVNDLTHIIHDIFKKILLPKKVKEIFQEVDKEELQNGIETTFKLFLQTRSFQKLIGGVASELAINLEKNGIYKFIHKEQLLIDLEKGIYKSLENNKNQEVIREITKNTSVILLNNFNRCLTVETKNYLLERILDGLMKSVIPHSSRLIRNIDFKGIVLKEINTMDPAKIEELFYGFAGVYFNRLIVYGFILGLPIGATLDFGLIGLVNYLFKE
ncbi:DUF445 family protein [Flammeovirga sp. SubArs3]|uniref:DUF445 family protein n=1 Tax=Flammeovirga sp. SubArs3 TaxID=2995316 RepID=UPI00248ADDDB|nr:DUF445 family protein [Flammeovirga sp. SubArs3]